MQARTQAYMHTHAHTHTVTVVKGAVIEKRIWGHGIEIALASLYRMCTSVQGSTATHGASLVCFRTSWQLQVVRPQAARTTLTGAVHPAQQPPEQHRLMGMHHTECCPGRGPNACSHARTAVPTSCVLAQTECGNRAADSQPTQAAHTQVSRSAAPTQSPGLPELQVSGPWASALSMRLEL
jgi:hypothetical protein